MIEKSLINGEVTKRFGLNSLGLTENELSEAMGYSGDNVPEYIKDVMTEVLNDAPVFFDLQGGYIIHDNIEIHKSDGKIIIDGWEFNVGRIISSFLKKAESIAVFVCTAGDGVTQWYQKETGNGISLTSYVIDALGSIAVERAMDIIENEMSIRLKKEGLFITNRYSPGYCGWDVSEQHKLFSLLPDHFCGISLTPSALMKPIKSISGIIGIGTEVKKLDYSCKICDMKDCVRRKI